MHGETTDRGDPIDEEWYVVLLAHDGDRLRILRDPGRGLIVADDEAIVGTRGDLLPQHLVIEGNPPTEIEMLADGIAFHHVGPRSPNFPLVGTRMRSSEVNRLAIAISMGCGPRTGDDDDTVSIVAGPRAMPRYIGPGTQVERMTESMVQIGHHGPELSSPRSHGGCGHRLQGARVHANRAGDEKQSPQWIGSDPVGSVRRVPDAHAWEDHLSNR